MCSNLIFKNLFCFLMIPCFLYSKPVRKDKYLVRKEKTKNSQMIMYKYRTDLFKQDYVITEYLGYQLLKKVPLHKKINYLAVPWARIINLKELDELSDDLLINNKIKLKGGFTICQHIKYQSILPILKRIGIDTLFSPHARANEAYEGIRILPFPHHAVNGVKRAKIKDIFYSFIGYKSHPVREQIFNMPVLNNCVIKERKYWHFSLNSLHPKGLTKEQQKIEKMEYLDVLAGSRFSLCPRGTGPITLHFWESLEAGAIPILIADEAVLPEGVNWQECIVSVPECDILKINDIILSITFQQEQRMRENCLKAFDLFSGKNFVRVIKQYYGEKE